MPFLSIHVIYVLYFLPDLCLPIGSGEVDNLDHFENVEACCLK